MAVTLPTFTQRIDDAFTDTWYEIQADAIDNILGATVIWNTLFMGSGCGVEQTGGTYIERTIKYNVSTANNVQQGDTLSSGETELETEALWTWKYIEQHIQRNFFKDQKNNGPAKIKSYVGKALTDAVDSMQQLMETNMLAAFQSSETGRQFQGLNDMIPPYANKASGTYGGITRPLTYSAAANGVESPATGNTFWGPKYLRSVLVSVDTTLLTDMKKLYNTIGSNQAPPNLIIMDQGLYEIYEEYGIDISQIIKDETKRLADLGFDVLRFKGKPMIWTGNQTANNCLMVNTDWIEIVYDPTAWFNMTDWKPFALTTDRICHILAALNCISSQLRRHGRLDYA